MDVQHTHPISIEEQTIDMSMSKEEDKAEKLSFRNWFFQYFYLITTFYVKL
jgi:hypothetical protein